MLKFMILFLLAFNLFAEDHELIKEHSQLKFSVSYLKISSVDGLFKDLAGHFQFDEKNGPSNVEIRIPCNSIFTNDTKRDAHLKTHDFFFCSNYPFIIFRAAKSKDLGKNRFLMAGELTFKEKKLPLSLKINYKGTVKDPWGKNNSFFELETILNRQTLGLKWNRDMDGGGLVIGDDVKVSGVIQSQLAKDKTSWSKYMIPASTQSYDPKKNHVK